MDRRIFLLCVAAAVLAACSRGQAPAGASGPDPAAMIAPIYQPYLAHGVLVGLQDQAPWTPDLRNALLAMMARSEAANEPILDFDPFIGAQDYEIAALSLSVDALVAGSHATVRAHFTNLGRDREILYDMVWREGAWRVDNIRGEDWDLRQIVAPAPQ